MPAGGNPPNTDGVQVRGGDVVTFRVDLPQRRDRGQRQRAPISPPEVWDVLPTGITLRAISAISDGGACTNPGDADHPTFSGSGTHSAVRWQLPATPTLAPGASATLTLRHDDPRRRQRQHVVPQHGVGPVRTRPRPTWPGVDGRALPQTTSTPTTARSTGTCRRRPTTPTCSYAGRRRSPSRTSPTSPSRQRPQPGRGR